MNISIGSDHRGYELKLSIKPWLENQGYVLIDAGTDSSESVDYPQFAFEVARTVAAGEADLGILICGTGIGMSIAANKVKGIRAARACTVEDAGMARRHNNANVLCLGADTVGSKGLATRIIQAWLQANFEEGRHQRRLQKISEFEGER